MIKKIVFPLISIFLVYNSIKLIHLIFDFSTDNFSLFAIIVISFALNLFITGVFAFIGFAYPTNRLLPNTYYHIKNPKILTSTYNLLGVTYFKMMLLRAFWGKEKNRKKYFNGTKSGIQQFDFQTRQSEFGHLGAFVAVLIVAFIFLFKGYLFIFIITSIINIISNLYPIILQRMHRLQIERITRRSQTK